MRDLAGCGNEYLECDGCGQMIRASELLIIAEGSLKVCQQCYPVASATVAGNDDNRGAAVPLSRSGLSKAFAMHRG